MKKEDSDNVINIDRARIKKLKMNGHYPSIVDKFNVLNTKFRYGSLEEHEAYKFVTLIKYLKDEAHTESLRLECSYLFENFIRKWNL